MKVSTAVFGDDGELDDHFAIAIHFDPQIGMFRAIPLELFVGETKIRRAGLNDDGSDLIRQGNQGVGENYIHDFGASNFTGSIHDLESYNGKAKNNAKRQRDKGSKGGKDWSFSPLCPFVLKKLSSTTIFQVVSILAWLKAIKNPERKEQENEFIQRPAGDGRRDHVAGLPVWLNDAFSLRLPNQAVLFIVFFLHP